MCADNRTDRVRAVSALVLRDFRGRLRERRVPSERRHPFAGLPQRRDEPALALQRHKAVSTRIAHPITVDAGIVTRLEAIDTPAMVMNVDRASAFASATDGRRLMQVPDAHAETEILLGQRAD